MRKINDKGLLSIQMNSNNGMHVIHYIFTLTICILLSACDTGTRGGGGERNDLYIIDFEQCLKTEQAMNISQIADTVEYLELKTPEGIIVSRISDVIMTDSFLFIESGYGAFKFTREGEFVCEFGRRGQGPGEYIYVSSMAIDPIKKEVVISDNGKLLFYDLNGNFIRTEKWSDLFDIAISDSVIWSAAHIIHIYKNIASALNNKGDTIAFLPNPVYGMKSLNEGVIGFLPKAKKAFYNYNGLNYLKGDTENDTVYQLSGKNMIPHAVINRGKYKLPLEYQPWYSDNAFERNGPNYWGVAAIDEDDRYFYLFALRYGYEGGDVTRYMMYDKETRKGFVVKNGNEDQITDDILGGPQIWPRWIADDYYINVVEPYELLEEVKNGQYTLASALERQLKELYHGANQLIVLCHKKK